jgi:hypothetical protein
MAATQRATPRRRPRAQRDSPTATGYDGLAYRLIHSYMAMPDATPALIERVEPYCGM